MADGTSSRPQQPPVAAPVGPPGPALAVLSRRGWIVLLLACALPHIVRWMLPRVAATDGYYAHAAWMISRGFTPYVQFVHVAFPFAEQALALVFRVCGHDVRVVEAVNLLVVLGVAAALAVAAQRLAGRVAGIVAALVWSGSLWVLHFHLFERETWAALGTALALVVCAEARPLLGARAGKLALALLLAVTVKLTAMLAVIGVGLHLLIAGRRRELLRVALLFTAGLLAVSLLCWLAWGRPFLVQVFLFGFFRNGPEQTFDGSLSALMLWTDPALALGLAGLIVWGLPRLRRPAGAAALVLACELAYLLLLNPVSRSHNLVSLMPGAAVMAGGLVAELLRRRAATTALATAVALVMIVLIVRRSDGLYMNGDYGGNLPGLGGDDRADIARHAEFLQRHSRDGDIVATTQPWWSLQAGRVEAVRYLDLFEVTAGLEASLRADGLRATWSKRQGPLLLAPGLPNPDRRVRDGVRSGEITPYAGRLLANALAYERPLLLRALARREIALVVEPLGVLSAFLLRRQGYERFEDAELGLAGWRPPGGSSQPVVRELFPR